MAQHRRRRPDEQSDWMRMRDPATGRECEVHLRTGWVRGSNGIALRPLRDPFEHLEPVSRVDGE